MKNVSPSSVVRSKSGTSPRGEHGEAEPQRAGGVDLGELDARVEARGPVHGVLSERQQHVPAARDRHGHAVIARIAIGARARERRRRSSRCCPSKEGKEAVPLASVVTVTGAGQGAVAGGASQPSTSTPLSGRPVAASTTVTRRPSVSAGSSVRVVSTGVTPGLETPARTRTVPALTAVTSPEAVTVAASLGAPAGVHHGEAPGDEREALPAEGEAHERELHRAPHDQHRRTRADGQGGHLRGRRGRAARAIRARLARGAVGMASAPAGHAPLRHAELAGGARPARGARGGRLTVPLLAEGRGGAVRVDQAARKLLADLQRAVEPGRTAAGGAKARQSVFSGHSAVDWQARYSRQRPAVALVQYCPEGQSASVAQSARAHRPASQMTPWAPHDTSLTHRRTQAPLWQTKSTLATWGSTPGAQLAAVVQAGRQAPCVTSQRWPDGQSGSSRAPCAVLTAALAAHLVGGARRVRAAQAPARPSR